MFFVYCDGEVALITPSNGHAYDVASKMTEYGYFAFVRNQEDFERFLIELPIRVQDENRFLGKLLHEKHYPPNSRQPSFKY